MFFDNINSRNNTFILCELLEATYDGCRVGKANPYADQGLKEDQAVQRIAVGRRVRAARNESGP